MFYTFDGLIRTLSVLPNKHSMATLRDYVRLPYFPRCFNYTTGGLIVAGGVVTAPSKVGDYHNLTADIPGLASKQSQGLFSIFSPAMEDHMTFTLGELINNCVTIYPKDGHGLDYTLYVCNNDSGLYIVDIGNEGVRATRKLTCESNTSLNNVHQLPDGRLLTATGDLSSIFLLDPKMAKPKVQTIATEHDPGFGVSYHNNMTTLAAAFEDGACLLYDIRNVSGPLHEIKSTRPGHRLGAFRCCKFLMSPTQDLLVVSEHVGRVHLVDLRDLNNKDRQVIVFPHALDQYSHYKNGSNPHAKKQLPSVSDAEEAVGRKHPHPCIDIYGDDAVNFTAPLVYDYSYLANEKPKLFSDYEYEPPQQDAYSAVPEMRARNSITGGWNGDNLLGIPTEIRESNVRGAPSTPNRRNSVGTCPVDSQNFPQHSRHHVDSYQQTGNHKNGEMELSGLDWFDTHLYIGCEDGGVLAWDVNERARRSFGSFSYA